MKRKQLIKLGLSAVLVGCIGWKFITHKDEYVVKNVTYLKSEEIGDDNFMQVYFKVDGKIEKLSSHKVYTKSLFPGLSYDITIRPNQFLRPDNEIIRVKRPLPSIKPWEDN